MSTARKRLAVGAPVVWAHPVHDRLFPEERWCGKVTRVTAWGVWVRWAWATKDYCYSWESVARGRVCPIPEVAA